MRLSARILLASGITAASGPALAQNYSFTTLDNPTATYPGGYTVAFGVNNLSQVAGYTTGPQGGFLYSGGTYTTIAYPPPSSTTPHGVNDSGQITGSMASLDGAGFLLSGGTYSALPIGNVNAGTNDTVGWGINNAGTIVGSYLMGSGFIYSGGSFTRLQQPNPSGDLIATGINNGDQVVGYYFSASGRSPRGFMYSGGTLTTIDSPFGSATRINGINDSGWYVGTYNNVGFLQSFAMIGGQFYTFDNPAATRTYAYGINNAGQIVGAYEDATGTHGFIASPSSINVTLQGFNQTVGSLAGGGIVTNGTATPGTVTVGIDNASSTFSGTVQDGAGVLSLTKVGTGTLTLSGTNTYTGATTISAGTLKAGSTTAFAQNSAFTVNATLDLAGFNNTVGSLAGNASGNVINSSSTTAALTVGGNNTSTTFAGNIQDYTTGIVSLTKTGTGTMTLSGVNGYRGFTTVSEGTLKAGANNGFSINSAFLVNATLDLGGFDSLIGSLSGNASGVITNSGATAASLTTGFHNTSTAFAGTIKDGASTTSLSKTGTGTQTLSGNNTYTGGTLIFDGTLALSGSGTLGGSFGATTIYGATLDLGTTAQTQNGGVTLKFGGTIKNGTLSSSTTFALESGTVGAVLAGSGVVEKTTSGTVTFSGANTYIGTTTVSGGTLKAGSANTFSADSETTVAGATLDLGGFAQTINRVTLSGGALLASGSLAGSITANLGSNTVHDIGGTASFTMQASLTQFSGHNTYSGATNIQIGAATALNANALSPNSRVDVGPNGVLALGGFNQTIGSLSGAGVVLLDADLTAGGDNSSAGFSGQLTGSGHLTKEGSGLMLLSGNSSAGYHGDLTVNGGVLNVQGSVFSSAIAVNASAALMGIGTVGAVQVNSGGKLAPGDGTPGSSMAMTSLSMQSGAQYFVALNPTTSSSAVVAGPASLGGATVNAYFAGGTYVEKRYTIVTATGVTGTFDPMMVNTNLPYGFKTSLNYDATHAYLDLSLAFVPPPGSGLSGNQANVGNAIINFFNTTGGIPLVFGALTPAGLTQLSGENATAPQQTTFGAMSQFINTITDSSAPDRGEPAGGSSSGYAEESMAYAAGGKARSKSERDAYAAVYNKAPSAPSFEQRWSVWAAGFGGSQRTEGSAVMGSSDTRSSIFGTAVGADYRFSPNTVAGFALAGGATAFNTGNLGNGRSDLFQAGGFVRHNAGAAYVTAALAYGWQNINTDRVVVVAGIDRLHAEFNARAWSGRLEGGYRVVAGGFGVTPYAAGQFTSFELPAYAEQVVTGANTFALAYGAQTASSTRSELGARADTSFAMQGGVLILRGRAAWAHDFNNNRAAAATFQTLPGASFIVNGAAMAPDAALVTASAEMKCLNGWSAAATFEGEFSRVTESYAGKATLRYLW